MSMLEALVIGIPESYFVAGTTLFFLLKYDKRKVSWKFIFNWPFTTYELKCYNDRIRNIRRYLRIR